MEVNSQINILKAIKEATKVKHDEIEQNALMKSVADNTIHHKNYYYLLQKFYGFHKSAEKDLLDTSLWREYSFDIEMRRKTPLLQKDLEFLGYSDDFASIPLCETMPFMKSDAARLGFLYVVEGSTLGGQVLSRQLKQKFDFTKEEGASYFNSYGKENLRDMWFGFQNLLESFAIQNPSKTDEIIDTAINTFDKLNIWLEK